MDSGWWMVNLVASVLLSLPTPNSQLSKVLTYRSAISHQLVDSVTDRVADWDDLAKIRFLQVRSAHRPNEVVWEFGDLDIRIPIVEAFVRGSIDL